MCSLPWAGTVGAQVPLSACPASRYPLCKTERLLLFQPFNPAAQLTISIPVLDSQPYQPQTLHSRLPGSFFRHHSLSPLRDWFGLFWLRASYAHPVLYPSTSHSFLSLDSCPSILRVRHPSSLEAECVNFETSGSEAIPAQARTTHHSNIRTTSLCQLQRAFSHLSPNHRIVCTCTAPYGILLFGRRKQQCLTRSPPHSRPDPGRSAVLLKLDFRRPILDTGGSCFSPQHTDRLILLHNNTLTIFFQRVTFVQTPIYEPAHFFETSIDFSPPSCHFSSTLSQLVCTESI